MLNNEPYRFCNIALSILVHSGVNGDSCEDTIATSCGSYSERSTFQQTGIPVSKTVSDILEEHLSEYEERRDVQPELPMSTKNSQV